MATPKMPMAEFQKVIDELWNNPARVQTVKDADGVECYDVRAYIKQQSIPR